MFIFWNILLFKIINQLDVVDKLKIINEFNIVIALKLNKKNKQIMKERVLIVVFSIFNEPKTVKLFKFINNVKIKNYFHS